MKSDVFFEEIRTERAHHSNNVSRVSTPKNWRVIRPKMSNKLPPIFHTNKHSSVQSNDSSNNDVSPLKELASNRDERSQIMAESQVAIQLPDNGRRSGR